MKILSGILLVLLLSACASYSGRGLEPGTAGYDDVIRVMGQPAMRWQNADGSSQLAYPRGPMGVQTFMAVIAADGKLKSLKNVLDAKHFAQIQPGMTKDQVLRILGPSEPSWTTYYARRDELVWEWRYCNELRQLSRFDVLFDGSKGIVRSSMGMTESQRGLCGKVECMC
ncbi:MAG: outer membrane protein assembly factor BamE [Sulfuriferula sp.]